MNTFCNGKEISKENLLSMIKESLEEGWKNSDLHRSTEIALEKIYYGGYDGVDEDINCILEKLNSKSLYGGYFYPNANLQDVETIISAGSWYFQENKSLEFWKKGNELHIQKGFEWGNDLTCVEDGEIGLYNPLSEGEHIAKGYERITFEEAAKMAEIAGYDLYAMYFKE